jgi:hypothetical protein
MDFLEEHEVAAFRNSGQFDEQWYVEQYPDVKIVGMDPAKHYLWLGARLGRRPSPGVERSTVPLAAASDREDTRKGGDDRKSKKTKSNALRTLTPELRSKIRESALFDEEYYRAEYADRILDHDDLLADYISSFESDLTRDPGRLFSTRHYFESHPDVRAMHPFLHYVQYGIDEGRAAFCPDKVNSFLSSNVDVELETLLDIVPIGRPINILYWDGGNFFFTDVAEYLEQLLNEQGYHATLRTDLPKAATGDALNLVVAPHEFCAIGPGRHWTADQYADALYVNTEQWQTSWFALSMKYLKCSRRGVLDLNPSSAQGLVKIGLRAAFIPLLPLPGSCFDFSRPRSLSEHVTRLKFIEHLSYPAKLHDRTYEIVCCAVLNDRRGKALARLAPILSAHRCFIHTPRFNRPIKPGEPDVLAAADFAQIARNSKIMLNIHQGQSHYLEWQRVFLVGMMQGAVVVTEPCYANRYVQPNVHYIESSLENMPRVVAGLLSTEHGKRKMSEIHANVKALRDAILAGERFLA